MKLKTLAWALFGVMIAAFCLQYASKRRENKPALSDPQPVATVPPTLLAEASGTRYLDAWQDLPPWAIQYGGEFWRKAGKLAAKDTRSPASNEPTFDVGEAVSRVSHAFLPGATEGTASAKAKSFTVEFANGGFSLSPHRFMGTEDEPSLSDPLSSAQPGKAARYAADLETRVTFKTIRVSAGQSELFGGTGGGRGGSSAIPRKGFLTSQPGW